MSIATIITILEIVNGLLAVAKDAPGVIDEAKSLLAKVEPHIASANEDVQGLFGRLQARVAFV